MARWFRWGFIWLILLSVLLLIFSAMGGATSPGFERYFPILIGLNILSTLGLFSVALYMCFGLYRRWRRQEFGSRMTARLALAIGFIAMLPCVLLYSVSGQFIGRSIDSWFDTRVEHALNEGIEMTSQLIARERERLRFSAGRACATLAATPRSDWDVTLERLREDNNVEVALIFSPTGNIVSSAIPAGSQAPTDIPLAYEYRSALTGNGFTALEGESIDGPEKLRIRALMPIFRNASLQKNYFLQFTHAFPTDFAKSANDMVLGFRDYQELVLTRGALQNIYRVTLTLTMLLAVFGALAASLAFAKSMTAPILQLALGTKKVAGGELQPIQEFAGNNEINELTQSFNSMVSQIAEARDNVENQRRASERSKAYLETVLGNISSGVLVLDESMTILMANAGAHRILEPSHFHTSMPLRSIEPELTDVIAEKIRVADNETFHADIDLYRAGASTPLPLFLRGSRLTFRRRGGWVIVFDDMSAVIDAQKAQAWSEVAQRLAHEIKNPLTPIRLAAERLEMKLSDKLTEKDAELLHRTSRTIVNQVDAMKQMVDDFRHLAKLPAPSLKLNDLNAFLDELGGFYQSAGTVIEKQFDETLPPIEFDPTQLRQVIHNLVTNAIDAMEGQAQPRLIFSTQHIEPSRGSTLEVVRLVISDTGPGFPAHILSKAFEPYVTTKPTGTGLGLPMVKKIIDEHHANVTISNRIAIDGSVDGAQVTIVFPVPAKEQSVMGTSPMPPDAANEYD